MERELINKFGNKISKLRKARLPIYYQCNFGVEEYLYTLRYINVDKVASV
jgi:hypothetical protein